MSKQRGTFSYPGSKTLIRRWIIKHIPEHHLYVEPFGGAASVLVGKERSPVEVYNDINSDVVTFFEAVKERADELAEWVEDTPYSRELFRQWCDEYPDWPDDLVEYAGRFCFVQQASFSGAIIGQSTPSFSVRKVDQRPDACNSKTWNRKPDDIRWLQERFKGVQIDNRDYEDVLERYDDEDAFFYCDPPYVGPGDRYYQTEEGGFDHHRFEETLMGLDADWLVSYGPEVPEELRQYHIIQRCKKTSMNEDRGEKTEALVMNYNPVKTPLMTEEEQSGLDAFTGGQDG